jgi:deazaflavin-dependent oxidoreductase (nitroreductase family)
VPLLFVRDGADVVIVASQGGHDTHPAWYRNLTTNPVATVQIGPSTWSVRAEELGPADRERLWGALVAAYPDYAEYRTRTAREFPVMALRPE